MTSPVPTKHWQGGSPNYHALYQQPVNTLCGDPNNHLNERRYIYHIDSDLSNRRTFTPSMTAADPHSNPFSQFSNYDTGSAFPNMSFFTNHPNSFERSQWLLPSTSMAAADQNPHTRPNDSRRSEVQTYVPQLDYAQPLSEETLNVYTPSLEYSSVSPPPTDHEATPSTFAGTEDSDSADPCYAQLLWRCLMETRDHKLTLKEIYSWVARNSPKAKDPSNKGWQNSVRHNLSMNAGFEKVVLANGQSPKKGNLWRLTDNAIAKGVCSTTRYRKDPKKKPQRSLTPAPKRVASGQKGGNASRRAANRRRAQPARNTSQPVDVASTFQRTDESACISPGIVTSHASGPVESRTASPYFLPLEDQLLPFDMPSIPRMGQDSLFPHYLGDHPSGSDAGLYSYTYAGQEAQIGMSDNEQGLSFYGNDLWSLQ